MNRHRPSILGCAFGFGAAGMGIGSLLGMWFGIGLFDVLLRVRMPADEVEAITKTGWMFTYATMYTGILLGILFGAITGLVYAVYKRRWLTVIDPPPLDSTT